MNLNLHKISVTQDLEYLIIFSLVLILPKILLRLRIPAGITALAIGVIASSLDPEMKADKLFRFLSQIGITSLFVFAGLEVNFKELKEDKVYLSKYISKNLLFIGIISFAVFNHFGLSVQSSLLISLGIMTPSAGFIINSLHSFNIGEDQEYWVKSKAISKEIVSIILLFIALQSGNLKSMFLSSLFFVALFLILPIVFKLFFKFISPIAPNTEIPFLVVMSLISGVISKELGAYYLVGAFIVGLIGSKFKSEIFKDDEEMLFTSLSSFFNVFLPFYFFYAGLSISFAGFSQEAITLGAIMFIIFVPLRFLLNSTSIKYFLKNFTEAPYTISLSLIPTLIFGLVIAGILQSKGLAQPKFIYALIFYTITTSLVPTILFPFQKMREKKLAAKKAAQ